MQPNPDTIRFLRQLTADGSLTDDEVWSLGNYLNDNHAARESWPGNLLFDILRVIFADSALDPRELQALAYYLRAIELQCAVADDEPAGATPKPAAEAFFETSDCRIPTIHADLDVAEKGALRKQAHVDLDKQQCNCSEWTFKRKFLPEGSPGRACKHMVQAIHSPPSPSKSPRSRPSPNSPKFSATTRSWAADWTRTPIGNLSGPTARSSSLRGAKLDSSTFSPTTRWGA